MSANFIVDLANGALVGVSQYAAATTTTGGHGAVDMITADGPIAAVLNVGTVSGTTPTLDTKLQEATSSAGAWSDITGATFTQVTTSQQAQTIRCLRTKQYVRATSTLAGTSPSFTLGVTLIGQLRKTGTGGGSSISPQV